MTSLAATIAQGAAQPGKSPTAQPVAWIRFTDAEETFQGTPYIWLERTDLSLNIDVAPRPGLTVELLWGSKRDERGATVTVNGVERPFVHGGYQGFQWVELPLPARLSGDRYEITLKKAQGKAAFLGGARVIASGFKPGPEPEPAAHKIAVVLAPPVPPVAFPEMRAIWDAGPPPNAKPLSDPRQEAAFRLAEKHGRQANEQFYRCRRFVDGWLKQADPATGLIPRNLTRDRDIWNAKDSAADNYPFMVLTAALTDRELFEGRMLDMLGTETRLTSRIDRLPDTWSFSKQDFATVEPDLASIIFGGSEYVKDGLLPLTEWLGPSPWSARMLGIMDDLWKHAAVPTFRGPIPSKNVEVNGEMLQALSRLFWMTGDRRYLEYAMRLGDHFLLDGNHPTRDFQRLRLRDHGCEIVSGISELYAAVHFAEPKKREAYREPVHAVFDRILEIGRDERGMLYNTIEPGSGKHDKGICDTWGYNYNGVYTVYLIDGTEAYRDAVRFVLGNLEEHLTDYHWGSADEYADSIEGAINLLNREPSASAARWIDSEIRDMWRPQQADGVIEGWHGDGNSARTAIMYALWKTQGLTIQPWREDVRLGAVLDDGKLQVSLIAAKPWRGRLCFDRPRHKLQMGLPLDYPRINQFPEWFTVETSDRCRIVNLADNRETTFTGAQLHEGAPIALQPGAEMRLSVSRLGR